LLGIANAATAYEYIKAGETSRIQRAKDFEEVPEDQVAAEKTERQERKKRIATIKKKLKADGILLFEEKHKDIRMKVACAAGDGFVLAFRSVASTREMLRSFGPPWNEPQPLQFEGAVWAISSDTSGQRIAVVKEDGVFIFNESNWNELRDLRISACSDLALSPDGLTVACAQIEVMEIYDTVSGKRLAVLPSHL